MLRPARFNQERITTIPTDDNFRKVWFDAHRAINMTSLSCVLAVMEEKGLPKEQAAAFKASAEATLALMATEINRLWGVLMWCAVRKHDGIALAWLQAATEEAAWGRLLAALSNHKECTVADAEGRGYTVKFIAELAS
jgi:hypothetical protein